MDPRLIHVTETQLRALQELGFQIQNRIDQAYDALRTIQSVRDQSRSVGERAARGGFGDELELLADSLISRLETIEGDLYQTRAESGQDMINFPPQLSNQLTYLYGRLAQAYGPPTAQERTRLRELESELAQLRGALQSILDTDLEAFNARARELGVEAVVIPEGGEEE
jgi:hypothetical protein